MSPTANLGIELRTVKNATVLDLKGRLIMGEPVDSFKKQVRDILSSGGQNLAVNLAGLTYVDSSGISSMIEVADMARKAGTQCKFFAATKRVLQLLRIARLETTIVMHADEASALLNY